MSSVGAVAARLDSLTGIRAAAAVLVFWHHGNEHAGDDLISSGMVGVSLFYILSGFVMAWTDRESDTAWQFYRRRFARIYPSYVVACVLSFGLLTFTTGFSLTDLSALTLMQTWVPSPEFYFAGNVVFWSLSCEAFFYLAYPAIRLLTRRLTNRGVAGLGVAAAALSLGIATAGSLFPVTPMLQWAVVVFPPSRLPEFVLGVVLGTLMARGWRARVPLSLASVLSVVAIASALFVPYAFSRYAVTLIPFCLLVLALASADLSSMRSFARAGWLVKLGVWSFCFYLLHAMVLSVLAAATHRFGIPDVVGVVVALPVAFLCAWMLHRLVEQPAERWLRSGRRPRLDDDPTSVTPSRPAAR